MNDPPSSLGCNSLDFLFGVNWKKNYMEIDLTSRLKMRELKKQIKNVWKDIAFNLAEIR